jgi:hypothetical protein
MLCLFFFVFGFGFMVLEWADCLASSCSIWFAWREFWGWVGCGWLGDGFGIFGGGEVGGEGGKGEGGYLRGFGGMMG